MQILQDKIYPNMYWVEWPDGTLSDDFYNITRAKEYVRRIPEWERESKTPIDRRHSAQCLF